MGHWRLRVIWRFISLACELWNSGSESDTLRERDMWHVWCPLVLMWRNGFDRTSSGPHGGASMDPSLPLLKQTLNVCPIENSHLYIGVVRKNVRRALWSTASVPLYPLPTPAPEYYVITSLHLHDACSTRPSISERLSPLVIDKHLGPCICIPHALLRVGTELEKLSLHRFLYTNSLKMFM